MAKVIAIANQKGRRWQNDHLRQPFFLVNSMTKLNFELKASGGSAVRLIPEKDVNKKLGNYKKQKL